MPETSRLELPVHERPAARKLLVLVAVVALAGLLRFYGLRWALPNSIRDYSYHPDEFLTIGAAFGRIVAHCTFDPGFYNYPTLYIYLSALAIWVTLAYGASVGLGTIYLAARAVAAAMGAAAVGVTYWAGKTNFGAAAGLIAALIVCMAPLHVQHSHFATVDVPSTLFVAAALGFAGLILRRGEWRNYIVGGVMCGFAAGTKYNAGLVLLSLVVAHLLRGRPHAKSLGSGKLWSMIGCALLAFVISTPGSVLRACWFLQCVGYELRHAAGGHGLVFAGTGNGFVYTFASSLWYGLGPSAILFVPAVLLAVIRREKAALCALAFVIPYYVLISLSQVRFARYALPMFPGIAIVTGWFVVELWAAFGRVRRWVWAAVCGVVIYWTLLAAVSWVVPFGLTDLRDQAAEWVRKNIPEGAAIGVIDVPWFYSPPLSKSLGFGTLHGRREAASESPYRFVIFADCERAGCWFEESRPRWVIISDFETYDALRLRGNLSISARSRAEVRRILSDLSLIKRHYVLRQEFGGPLGAFKSLGFPDPPHDMRYVQPEVSIYERKR